VRDGDVVEIIHGAAQNVIKFGPNQLEFEFNDHMYPEK
jgi:hypothetical protein